MKSFDSTTTRTTDVHDGAAPLRKRIFPFTGLVAGVCAMMLFALPGCMRQRQLEIYMPATLLIGKNLPTLAEGKWFNSDGATSTDAYRGKVVVMQFGFTACASCAKFEPRIKEVLDKYPDEEVVMVCVMDGRMDSEEDVRRYIREKNVKGPVVLDTDGRIFDRLEIISSPSVFVANGTGKILWWQATVREALVDEWILEALAQNEKLETGRMAG